MWIVPRLDEVEHGHLPLPGDQSYRAARLAECAARQGRFEGAHRILYEAENTADLPYRSVAEGAHIPDRVRFEGCASNVEPVLQIERDIRSAQGLDIQAVPAVILDGTLLGPPPDSTTLMELVRKRLEGRVN